MGIGAINKSSIFKQETPMDISRFPYFSYSQLIDQTLAPLTSEVELPFFSFRRRFNNFEQICMFKAREFTIDYYAKEFYKIGYFEMEAMNYEHTFYMWDHLSGPSLIIYEYMRQKYAYAHGLTILLQNDEYCDFFSFGAHANHDNINNFYLNKKDLFLIFINQFYQNTGHIFQHLSKYKFYLPGNPMNKDKIEDMLSPRQLECGQLILSGLTAKEIGRKLNLSPRTVEDHIQVLKVKLGAKNRAQLTYLLGRIIG